MLRLRDEGYGGEGSLYSSGVDKFADMAFKTLRFAEEVPIYGTSYKFGDITQSTRNLLGSAFITDNIVKRLGHKESAKRLAMFLQENASEIVGKTDPDTDKRQLLDHLEGDIDELTDSITERSEQYLKLVKDAAVDRQSETQAIKNGMLFLAKRYGLDARYAMSLFVAKPDIAKRLIQEGEYSDDIKSQLTEVLDIGKSLMEEITLKDRRHGVLDETQLRSDYLPSRAPLSRSGERTMLRFLSSNVDSDEAQAILNRIGENF